MKIGNKISDYRKNRGMTQDALAQLLGVTNQAVSKWESGQACPDIQLLPLLADVFETTVDELLGREKRFTVRNLPWADDETLRVVVYQGHRLLKCAPAEVNVTFVYEGPALNIDSAISVACTDVAGDVDAGNNVSCGNVGGDVDAGNNVTCGDVEGDVDAGGSIICGDVNGNVDAGNQVQCGSVGGDVEAGGFVSVQK